MLSRYSNPRLLLSPGLLCSAKLANLAARGGLVV
jgi:hypothetical protein